ncbi:MAG: FAD-binding oxidoreductase [Rhodobacteraceae bacterium]|jgi:glycine/D-amino acid oxidase-like deaminating enzyme|nr:FAD-binding oxidoreductase [Paracoccaceae bacterium]
MSGPAAGEGLAALALRPVSGAGDPPAEADAVVIGGGIAGAAAAWHLAQRGLRVVLCEKGIVAGEQSGRNWGWCRNTLRDPAEIPLMLAALRDWRDPAVFGALDTGFRTTGIAYFTTPDTLADHEDWLSRVCNLGLDSRMLSRAELDALLPGNRGDATGAVYTASDGCAEPDRATAAIAEAARALGAVILTTCAVRGFERAAGRLSAVVTERGTIRAPLAILAGGIWSRLLLRSIGVEFPQLKVLGSVSVTAPLAAGPDVSVCAPSYGWRRRLDGGYVLSRANATYVDVVPDSFRLAFRYLPLLKKSLHELRFRVGRRFLNEAALPRRWALDGPSPFETVRIADPAPVRRVLERARRAVGEEFQVFAGIGIDRSWGGFIDVTPDALPAIGPVDALPGLCLATGLSGHGFGIGPGAGRLAADLATGATPVVDPAPFAPARFGV